MAYGSNTFTVTTATLKQSQGKHRKYRPSNKELARRLDELEQQFELVVEAIRRLTRPSVRKRRPIGFRAKIRKK